MPAIQPITLIVIETAWTRPDPFGRDWDRRELTALAVDKSGNHYRVNGFYPTGPGSQRGVHPGDAVKFDGANIVGFLCHFDTASAEFAQLVEMVTE